MLMHHADAVADRLARGADSDWLAVDADFTSVGFIKAVQNRHQRRFAGAVLADNAVNHSAFDDEIDVVVGVNRAEALIDTDEFDGGSGWRRHQLDQTTRRRPNILRRQPNGDDRRQASMAGLVPAITVTSNGFRRARSAQGHLLSVM